MARIVMKFGGTSMAGTERIRRVAQIVKRQAEGGHEVAVVVSAMAGETDRLVQFCREANPLFDPAEYDVVVASGEQVTSGLLAMTLQAIGAKARSWMGWLSADCWFDTGIFPAGRGGCAGPARNILEARRAAPNFHLFRPFRPGKIYIETGSRAYCDAVRGTARSTKLSCVRAFRIRPEELRTLCVSFLR